MKTQSIKEIKKMMAKFEKMPGLKDQARRDVLKSIDLYTKSHLFTLDIYAKNESTYVAIMSSQTFKQIVPYLHRSEGLIKMTASDINAKASEALKAVNAHYEYVVNQAKAYGVSTEVIINYEAKESETEQENNPKVKAPEKK